MEYKGDNVVLRRGQYTNGRLALQLDTEDGFPYATLTVNMPEHSLREGEAYIKDYSENEGMLNWMEKQELVKEVLGYVKSGYVQIPRVKLDMEKIEEVTE